MGTATGWFSSVYKQKTDREHWKKVGTQTRGNCLHTLKQTVYKNCAATAFFLNSKILLLCLIMTNIFWKVLKWTTKHPHFQEITKLKQVLNTHVSVPCLSQLDGRCTLLGLQYSMNKPVISLLKSAHCTITVHIINLENCQEENSTQTLHIFFFVQILYAKCKLHEILTILFKGNLRLFALTMHF